MANNFLFISRYAGFEGGLERYVFAAATQLRRAGLHVCCAGLEPGRDAAQFATGFDAMLTFDEAIDRAAEFDLAMIHKLYDLSTLKKFKSAFGRRLMLTVHDHEPYCPRTYYYTPFGRKSCHRAYRWMVCTPCALATNPRKWKTSPLSHIADVAFNCGRRLDFFRRLSKTVVLSEFMRDNLLRNGFSSGSVEVVPPTVELPERLKSPVSGVPTLLFTARLLRGKGGVEFIELLSRLRHDFKALVVGDGDQRGAMEANCRRFGIADRVKFTGWVSNPEDYAAQADLVVLPFCWQEPFGLVGAEAAARGLAVAAYDIGGVREYVIDGETGVLTPPGDLERLATEVDGLLAAPDKIDAMGRRGRELAAAKFAPEVFVANYRRLADGVKA